MAKSDPELLESRPLPTNTTLGDEMQGEEPPSIMGTSSAGRGTGISDSAVEPAVERTCGYEGGSDKR